jgi:hypothetical protein
VTSRHVLAVFIVLLLAAHVPAATAKLIWLLEGERLVRVDSATSLREALPMAGARTIAPTVDGGAWALTDEAFVLFDDALAVRLRIPLAREQIGTIGAVAVDAGDGSLWYASGPLLVHVDRTGMQDRRLAADGPVLAIAVGGPDALFVASPASLTRFDSEGHVVGRFVLGGPPGGETKAILDDPLAGFVWLVREGAVVQFDALFGLAPRTAIFAPGLSAASIDAETGTLTLLVSREILRYDRNGAPVAPGTFASEALSHVVGVATPGRDPLLWFADGAGLGTIDPNDGVVLRFGESATQAFAAAPMRFEPQLDADVAGHAVGVDSTAVTLRFGASCDRFPCEPLPAYLHGLRLEARQGDEDVAGQFAANPGHDRFSAELPIAPGAAAPPLQAWVVDARGNRSNTVTIAWPATPHDALRHPLAAPTIAITAPLNNSTFTAPLNTTIKATATPGTGATIIKVDFYAGPKLLGTVAASPYNFTWSNVQAGSYALTAKVTDSLSATATSAVVNLAVNAGAMAKPIDAYLFNDAWSTTGVVTDAAGVHNGAPTGTVTPVVAGASAPKPDTCKAATFGGGAIDVGGLAVSVAAAAKATLAFWMNWNGTDGVMPIGWISEGLSFSAGSFGFTTQNGDVYGIASSGLAGKWHHVVAEFTNGAVAANKLYVDGVPQTLSQRTGSPNNANAVVAATLRFGGLTGSASYRFAGQLDEVKVFNRALTATEVSAEFAAANACGPGPSVALTSPANNTSFVAPASVAMMATAAATASGATLTKVDFYNGATLLKTLMAPPYAYTWANVPIGDYALTAKATDSKGTTATSAVATVHVRANVAPSVALTAPPNNSNYTAPATINLAATASDTDGTIAKVEFYQGTTRLGTVTAPPYAYTWMNVAGGTYSLTAKATDDRGAVTTSAAVTVKVNKVPTVSITAPANNATVVLPATVTINASASDADGTISKVEFFRDGVLLGADTTSPYSYGWANPPAGTYVITAKATDNLGAVTTSASVTITVKVNQAPTVSITSPASGAQFLTGVPVTLSANATDADGSIVRVEFYVDAPDEIINHALFGLVKTAPYSISKTLYLGKNTFTAVAVDDKGATTTSAPVTVTAVENQPPTITLTAPNAGQVILAPSALPDVTISASAADADGAVTAVRFYKQSEGLHGDPAPVLLATLTAPPYQTTWTSVPYTDSPPGGVNIDVHMIWAEATDTSGTVTVSDRAGIYVWQSPPASAYTVKITSPYSALGGSQPIVFSPPATVVLSADVTLGPGASSIAKVEFIANGSTVGMVATPNGSNGEFVSIWRSVPAGHYVITARSTDAGGFTSTSDPIMIDVAAGSSPTVTLLAPTGEQITQYSPGGGAPVTVTASLADPGGNVSVVELDDNYYGIAYLASAPYSGTSSGGWRGVHVLAASALDSGYHELARSSPAYIVFPQSSRPPLAVMTSPTQGASYSAGMWVTLSVDAMAPDDLITQVSFYSGGTLLKTLTAPPYTFSGAFASGTQSVYALVQSWFSYAVTPAVSFSVGGAASGASIALTAPVDGQRFAAPASVPLAASLTDPGGIITRVDYFATVNVSRGLKASSTQAPWTATWPNVAAGDYVMTAEGVYSGGRITSAPVLIHVAANTAPSVTITSPKAGATLYANQSVPVTVSATDADGTVAKVELFANGTLIGTLTAAPYTFNWVPTVAGSYSLTAKATDGLGAPTTSAAVSVTVNANTSPVVDLMLPQAGQQFAAGGTINLVAKASDSGGSIAHVDFYAGSTFLGSVGSAPYALAWTGVPAGPYALIAKAVDDHGVVTTSAVVNVSVQPLALTATSPAEGASIASDFVLVRGTYQAPPNSGVTVNGVVAANDGQGNFFINNFPLAPGPNTLTITLSSSDGQTSTLTRNVTSTGLAPFQITAESDNVLAPGIVTFRVARRGVSPVVSWQVANLSDGTVDSAVFDGVTLTKLTLTTPGVYSPAVTVTDSVGNTYTQIVALVVSERNMLDASLRTLLAQMMNALTAGDTNTAMSFLSTAGRGRYTSVFAQLAVLMPTIVASWSAPQASSLHVDIGEYTVRRVVAGVKHIYFIYMLKDDYGIWRIDSL